MLQNSKSRTLGKLNSIQSNLRELLIFFLFVGAGGDKKKRMRYDYQVINVNDYKGQGESEPVPYFYQNVGEAEYCVAAFMYMRLLG